MPADASRLAGTAMPRSIAPALATLAQRPPDGPGWLHEVKFDGYRLMLRRERGGVRCLTRSGHDWTDRFTPIARAAAALRARSFMIDGEAVVVDADGRSNFQKLQKGIKEGLFGNRLFFYAFDLPWLDAEDLRGRPIELRKDALQALLEAGSGLLRYSGHIEGSGSGFYAQACRIGLEGVVSKRLGSRYVSGRGPNWIKTKCVRRQEFIIGGWTDPEGARVGFGALLLGVNQDGRLRFVGKVGTGFDNTTLRELHARLRAIPRKDPPFASVPRELARSAHWVEPRLVAEVAYAEITGDGHLRHPSFQGLREDKDPSEIVLETARPLLDTAQGEPMPSTRKTARKRASAPRRPARKDASATVAGVLLSHPDRTLFKEIGLTKEDFARCMERLAPHMLPFVGGRPLSLIRCPQGPEKGCFFQKHFDTARPRELHPVAIQEKEGGETVTYVHAGDVAGLVALVQIGIVEIHPWGSRVDAPYEPDQVIFDLDPGPGVVWEQVLGASFLLRDMLEAEGLRSFVKTSGGKGLHIYVPIERGPSWDAVKAWSREIATRMARRNPDQLVATASKAAREGKIYVDYLRNGRGATCIGAYCPRARPGAAVSTPVTWDEVAGGVRADQFTLGNIFERLDKQAEDPWAQFGGTQQQLPVK